MKKADFVVSEGDLVIRKGKHQARVFFVEYVDRNRQGDVTGILLVNGFADKSFGDGSEPITSFFKDYRLLARESNLERERESV